MRYLAYLFLFLVSGLHAAHTLDDGKQFGKDLLKDARTFIENAKTEDFFAKDEEFDPEEAKKMVEEGICPDNDGSRFLNDKEVIKNETENMRCSPEEGFIQRSQEITEGIEDSITTVSNEEETNITHETCKQAGKPFPISYERELTVNIGKEEIQVEVKVCDGHKKKKNFFWLTDAEDYKKKKKKELSNDSSIQSFDVHIDHGGAFSDHTVVVKWVHVDDTAKCDDFSTKSAIQEILVEKEDSWNTKDPQSEHYIQIAQCALLDRQCFDTSPKMINGKEVHRKCWREKVSYLCQFEQKEPCIFPDRSDCREIGRKCLEMTSNGCALWEINFRCSTKKHQNSSFTTDGDLVGSKEGDWETDYEDNNSFSDVCIKLSIFDEISKELSVLGADDATKVQIFKGNKRKCSKSIADNLMYDCCYSFSGLADQLKLSHCDAEELALAEMREKGFCHYIGKKKEDFLGLWTSRDEHVYCCFSSKLSRVFQEQGRLQLNMDWGSAEKPDCRGLYSSEISQINFSKLDVSELVDQSELKKQYAEGKLEAFGEKLRNKIKEEEE